MARARSLSEFQTSFPDERSCAAFLFERRWPQGFVCPTCGGGRAVLLKSRAHTYECLDCGRQTSLTAGTAMHRSKFPLTIPAKASRQSGASRGAEEQRPECGQTDQDPKNSNPAPFWI